MVRHSCTWIQPDLIKVPIRPIHRGPTLNDILPRLPGVKYLMLINSSSGYNNLKLDEQSSYLGTFSCPLGRYIYIQFLFGVSPVGDMFQKKIVELYNGMPNVFGIAGDILIEGFDELGWEHGRTLKKVLMICGLTNLKPRYISFQVHQCSFLW